jgi:hypothetical protein
LPRIASDRRPCARPERLNAGSHRHPANLAPSKRCRRYTGPRRNRVRFRPHNAGDRSTHSRGASCSCRAGTTRRFRSPHARSSSSHRAPRTSQPRSRPKLPHRRREHTRSSKAARHGNRCPSSRPRPSTIRPRIGPSCRCGRSCSLRPPDSKRLTTLQSPTYLRSHRKLPFQRRPAIQRAPDARSRRRSQRRATAPASRRTARHLLPRAAFDASP